LSIQPTKANKESSKAQSSSHPTIRRFSLPFVWNEFKLIALLLKQIATQQKPTRDKTDAGKSFIVAKLHTTQISCKLIMNP
jgi:hypothetical protein